MRYISLFLRRLYFLNISKINTYCSLNYEISLTLWTRKIALYLKILMNAYGFIFKLQNKIKIIDVHVNYFP